MMDQASLLREQVEKLRFHQMHQNVKKSAKTIAVISGKGGVGKSNFSLNFSISLQNKGYKVLLFDLDIGMANLDILMGTTQQYNIVHLFEQNLTLKEIVQKGPANLSYIAGGTGLAHVFSFDQEKRNYFLSQLWEASYAYDYIIFDMGAGITDGYFQLLLSVEEIFLLTTCEPTSLTDAYSALKFLEMRDKSIPFYLIINKSLQRKHASKTAERFQLAAKQFLGKDLYFLGIIPNDHFVSLAVMEQTSFMIKYPFCPASKEINRLAALYEKNFPSSHHPDKPSFIAKLFR